MSALISPAQLVVATFMVAAPFACGAGPGGTRPEDPDLGVLSRPRVVTARDGGAAALIQNRMLWTFGDTLMTVTGADGFNYRSATAAWGDGASLALTDSFDAAGAPFQLLPFTDAEVTYNRAGGPNERIALWPGSAIADSGGGALIFFSSLKVHPGALNFEALGAGVARLAFEQTVAVREPALLFSAPEPSFSVGGVVADGLVYLYGCEAVPEQLDSVCRVARAPLDLVTARTSWQVWDGAGWTSTLTAGQPVLRGPPGELSVSWNPHLSAFLAVHSAILSNEVVFRTAPRPEGPWSAPRHLLVGLPPPQATGNNYAAREHPELAGNGGRTLFVTYAHPLGAFEMDLRVAQPTLP